MIDDDLDLMSRDERGDAPVVLARHRGGAPHPPAAPSPLCRGEKEAGTSFAGNPGVMKYITAVHLSSSSPLPREKEAGTDSRGDDRRIKYITAVRRSTFSPPQRGEGAEGR